MSSSRFVSKHHNKLPLTVPFPLLFPVPSTRTCRCKWPRPSRRSRSSGRRTSADWEWTSGRMTTNGMYVGAVVAGGLLSPTPFFFCSACSRSVVLLFLPPPLIFLAFAGKLPRRRPDIAHRAPSLGRYRPHRALLRKHTREDRFGRVRQPSSKSPHPPLRAQSPLVSSCLATPHPFLISLLSFLKMKNKNKIKRHRCCARWRPQPRRMFTRP